MAKGWPNSFLSYPFSGIRSGYVIHPYHVSDVYDEISGVEDKLGLMPIVRNAQTSQTFNSFTERVSGIETGYARGPHGATDGRIVLFDSTTGKLLKQANLGISSNSIQGSDAINSISLGPIGNDLTISSLGENVAINILDGALNVTAQNSGIILTTLGATTEFIAPSSDNQGTLGKSSKYWNSIYVNNIYKDGLPYEPVLELPMSLMTGYNAPAKSGVIPVYQGNGYNELGPSSLYIIQESSATTLSGSNINIKMPGGNAFINASVISLTQNGVGHVTVGNENRVYITAEGASAPSGVGLSLLSENVMRFASKSGLILVGSPGDPYMDWEGFTPTSIVPITSGSGHIGMYYSYWNSGYFNSTVTNKLILNGVEYTSIGGTGDVVGPASATDNAIVRFDTGTGKLIQNSSVIIGDGGHVLPGTSGAQNIGAPTLRWSGVHVNTVNNSVVLKTVFMEEPGGAVNGSNRTYTLANAPYGNSLMLYMNGLLLVKSGLHSVANDYILSGNVITTQDAPVTGSTLIAASYGYIA